MKRHFANMVFALILAAYTVYAALDTFVIVRVLTPDTLPTATAEISPPPPRLRTPRPPRRLRRNLRRNRRPPRPFPPIRNTTTTKSTLC